MERVENGSVIARNRAGEERIILSRQSKAYDVQQARPIEIAAGDRLLLTGNRRDQSFRATNGELVTVKGFVESRIQLEDGRILPADYKQFTHGYAVTAHRSQGKTVDSNILAGDRMSRELFYVGVSRGRESLTVVTSDTESFRESIGISGERQSATELARKQQRLRTMTPTETTAAASASPATAQVRSTAGTPSGARPTQ